MHTEADDIEMVEEQQEQEPKHAPVEPDAEVKNEQDPVSPKVCDGIG